VGGGVKGIGKGEESLKNSEGKGGKNDRKHQQASSSKGKALSPAYVSGGAFFPGKPSAGTPSSPADTTEETPFSVWLASAEEGSL